jgi:GrpB-like predicted nucleotidyltransferase (UPF0157 family)
MPSHEELGKLYPIFLEEYNPEWEEMFEKERMLLLKLLPGIAGRIEHIGSTAIPGMKSKPTIDILADIPDDESIKTRIYEILEPEGYIKMDEQKEHLMFVKGYTPTGLDRESFHIHMGPTNQNWLWDRIYFRDYLIENNDVAREYEKLKMDLASKYRNNREEYTLKKEEFVIRTTEYAKEKYMKSRTYKIKDEEHKC